jgi:hypothetical protein
MEETEVKAGSYVTTDPFLFRNPKSKGSSQNKKCPAPGLDEAFDLPSSSSPPEKMVKAISGYNHPLRTVLVFSVLTISVSNAVWGNKNAKTT